MGLSFLFFVPSPAGIRARGKKRQIPPAPTDHLGRARWLGFSCRWKTRASAQPTRPSYSSGRRAGGCKAGGSKTFPSRVAQPACSLPPSYEPVPSTPRHQGHLLLGLCCLRFWGRSQALGSGPVALWAEDGEPLHPSSVMEEPIIHPSSFLLGAGGWTRLPEVPTSPHFSVFL